MRPLSRDNFGIVIAFILPGAILMWGIADYFPAVSNLLNANVTQATTISGFLYATLLALLLGIVASTVRWLILDHAHQFTGLRPPSCDFSQLGDRVEAYHLLVVHHYNFYQFYGNSLVAAVSSYAMRPSAFPDIGWRYEGIVISFAIIMAMGSRDSLAKYYTRVSRLLRIRHPKNKKSSWIKTATQMIARLASRPRSTSHQAPWPVFGR